MSAGITPDDFVQQVYFQQERVLLDFWPSDDKYKEALMDGNFVLQELQKEEDWLWLRDSMAIGLLDTGNVTETTKIPTLPIDTKIVYCLSGLFGDCVHLYRHTELPNPLPDDINLMDYIVTADRIDVPLMSAGSEANVRKLQVSMIGQPNVPNYDLGCFVLDDKLCFNRMPWGVENDRIVVIDFQRRLPLFDLSIEDEDFRRTKPVLTMIPDVNYVVIRTAYYHAMGSPTAQGNIAYLQDMSTKLLSAMRQNNAAATTSDHMDWYTPGFWDVV